MKLQVLAIYDEKLEGYLPPFMSPAIGKALRSFIDHVNNIETEIHKHPKDYSLYHIGEYDADSAVYTQPDKHKLLMRAQDAVSVPTKVDGKDKIIPNIKKNEVTSE